MGLSIRDIIPKKEIDLSELKGKILCVDAFNAIYQFLSSIRQPDGTPLMDNKQRITSHLSGILYRNTALLEQGIKLVYVFDGKPPELKAKTHKLRRGVKDLAKEKYEEAKSEEDLESMKRYSSQLVHLDEEKVRESKRLLEAMGIAVIQAPSEGESEAAFLASTHKEIFGVASQDYDSLLFGAPHLIQNLTLARKRKTISGYREVKPELIELSDVLKNLEIDRDQLICLGILVGTDYNPKGIPGIGQKKALQIVKQYKQPTIIFKEMQSKIDSLSEEDKFDWQEIFSLFHKPSVVDSEIKFPKLNPELIKKILIEEHDFSEERVDKQIERLVDLQKQSNQKDLKKWF